MPEPRIVHTVCSHDCPDSCAVLVTVDELGKATRVHGDPAHPVTRGFLCGKVAKYLDRVYSPSRLLYPMRRRDGAPKGRMPYGREADVFERIGWDQALDLIAERLRLISEEYGPESILPYSYAGTIGLLGYGSMDRRFFHRLGASRLDRTICSTTGGDALVSVYGKKLGTDTEHFRHSRYIIAWGANIHGNNVHLWPFVEEARRHGARLVVIDPYRTRTARAADWHIAIQPGTDAALALGLMRILIEEGLYDRNYVAEHTHGFEALRDHVQPYTPEHVAGVTGIAAADIKRLAREYAASVPAVIRMNYGIQRSQNGGAAARAVCMLPALIGAWKHLGGGLQLSTSGAFAFNSAALERPDLMLASPLQRPARIVNMSRLGHALTELGTSQAQGQTDGPPVKALFVYNSNPAAIAPNQNAVVRGLMRSDLFTVVHEQFFTDTTDYADIVLPATTFLEHKDIQGAYGHYSANWGSASASRSCASATPSMILSTRRLLLNRRQTAPRRRILPGKALPDRNCRRKKAYACNLPRSARADTSCPLPMVFLPPPVARLSFIRARWQRRGSTRCRRFIRRTNRARAPILMRSRLSSCPARPTTI